MSILPQVRPDERRETLWALVTIFFVLVAHALLETARDALFLAHLPASQLPWVYLALAALALLASRPLARSRGARRDLRELVVLQVVAAAGAVLLFFVARSKPPWALYAVYVWGGLASTLILIRFWLLLAGRFTIGQAKRLFPVIAAGPLLGSIVGYAGAGALCAWVPPIELLDVSAAFFLLSAGSAILFSRVGSGPSAPADRPAEDRVASTANDVGWRESVRLSVRHPYVRRVALLLLTASVTVTLGDFIFKSVVAREIPPARLGSFLSLSYLSFDLIALALLFTAVGPFVRSRGISDALAVQPVLLIGGGLLLTATGGLAAVVCLRGVDGALRWSLHKTATELLYVPLSPRMRNAVKALSDVVAHRGGQALASLLILAWLAFSPSERMMGPIIVACCGVWVYLAFSLRKPYLGLFRESLSQRSFETQLEFPDLNMASLETLIAALSHPDPRKVVAAMDLLEQTDRVQLIPGLILYHPSTAVVLRALDLFAAGEREDVLLLSRHLLERPEPAVRAATIRACALLRPDPEALASECESEVPSVAATALVVLAGRGGCEPETAVARLDAYADDSRQDAAEVRRILARVLCDYPLPAFANLRERLACEKGDVETRRDAIRSMGNSLDERHLPTLIRLLAERELREAARQALLAFGEVAALQLERALVDASLPRAVRIHLPRTLSRFATQSSVDALLRQLLAERSGTVRYRILRGLGRLVADDPGLRVAPELVDQVVDRQLNAIVHDLHWQATLEQGIAEDPRRNTAGAELLADLLEQRETLARERLFRALGLRYGAEDLAQIHAGLAGPDAARRANSRELLLSILPGRLRKTVVPLTEDLPPAERLDAVREHFELHSLDYDALVLALANEDSLAVRSIASFHASEIGLSLDAPAEQAERDDGWFAALRLRGRNDGARAAAAGGRA